MNDAFDTPETLPFNATAPYGRPSWSGLLQFSLVGIPLKAYPAVRTRDLPSGHLLHAKCGWPIAQAQRWCPVRYVVFDLLCHAGRCLLHEPLARRRELLAEIVERLDEPEVIFSAGVVGAGTAFYATALAQGHEGVMAKHLSSTYRPGRRSPAWRKIKPKTAAKE